MLRVEIRAHAIIVYFELMSWFTLTVTLTSIFVAMPCYPHLGHEAGADMDSRPWIVHVAARLTQYTISSPPLSVNVSRIELKLSRFEPLLCCHNLHYPRCTLDGFRVRLDDCHNFCVYPLATHVIRWICCLDKYLSCRFVNLAREGLKYVETSNSRKNVRWLPRTIDV